MRWRGAGGGGWRAGKSMERVSGSSWWVRRNELDRKKPDRLLDGVYVVDARALIVFLPRTVNSRLGVLLCFVFISTAIDAPEAHDESVEISSE
jgi:hypothetical protein